MEETKGTERDFAWGGRHTMQCADDILLSCVLGTCMVLQTNIISINSNIMGHDFPVMDQMVLTGSKIVSELISKVCSPSRLKILKTLMIFLKDG